MKVYILKILFTVIKWKHMYRKEYLPLVNGSVCTESSDNLNKW